MGNRTAAVSRLFGWYFWEPQPSDCLDAIASAAGYLNQTRQYIDEVRWVRSPTITPAKFGTRGDVKQRSASIPGCALIGLGVIVKNEKFPFAIENDVVGVVQAAGEGFNTLAFQVDPDDRTPRCLDGRLAGVRIDQPRSDEIAF